MKWWAKKSSYDTRLEYFLEQKYHILIFLIRVLFILVNTYLRSFKYLLFLFPKISRLLLDSPEIPPLVVMRPRQEPFCQCLATIVTIQENQTKR